MRAIPLLLASLLLMAIGQPAHASRYVCDTKHAYTLQNGELRAYREDVELLTWQTVIVDAGAGTLKYGREERPDQKGHWKTERLTIKTTGEVIAGYYLHNGAIFSSIEIHTYASPAQFIWTRGGNSDALTGVCRKIG